MDNIPKSYYDTARARAAGSDLARFLRQLGTQVTSRKLSPVGVHGMEYGFLV